MFPLIVIFFSVLTEAFERTETMKKLNLQYNMSFYLTATDVDLSKIV